MSTDRATPQVVGSPPSAPGGPGDLIGVRVGPYVPVEVLGEGGFGVVYGAEQVEPVRRRVALKVVKPGMDSRAVLARFDAERQALALMDHPSVAKVLDAGATERGLPYFVMEHVPGVPITEYCRTNRLGIRERLELFIAVCDAVQHAHQKGIIHRDLKPTNILVMVQEQRPLPKVIDFGIAKALFGPLTDRTVYTEHGQLIGTPEYMSPEQARGIADDVDTRTDVYSLGAVLYELLTGETPLDTRTLRAGGYADVSRAIEQTEPQRPSTRLASRQGGGSDPALAADAGALARRLRGDLDWVVMKCLEKDRTRRYASASELAADVRRFLNDQTVTARPPSVSYAAAKFVRRHRGAVAAAGALAAALILGTAGTAAGLVWALSERNAANTARDESEQVVAFLSDMLESVSPGESGRDVTVRQILDRTAATIGERFADRPIVEARLRHTMGRAFWELGDLPEADEHLTAAYELRREHLGEDHRLTLLALSNLAGLRLEQDRHAEAAELGGRALDGFRRTVGDTDQLTIGAMNNLAQTLGNLGRYDQAEALQRHVVNVYRELHGPTHRHTLGAMSNLSLMLQRRGDLAGALEMAEAAVEGWRTAHGESAPGTLMAMHNLGLLYAVAGRNDEAAAVQRRVLDQRITLLGERHPDTGRSLVKLADAEAHAGRADEAERLYARALDVLAGSLGSMHDDTLTAAENFVELYGALGSPERLRPRIADALRIIRAAAQAESATPRRLNAAAWFLLTIEPEALRDPRAALSFAEKACAAERAARGSALWEYLDTLALAQASTGNPAAAAATQREAIALLPPHGEPYRAEMEARFAEFEAAARK